MTVDTDKNLVSAGIGYRFGKLRLDAMVGHAFMGSRDLRRGTSCAPQLNPIRPPPGDCVHDGSPERLRGGRFVPVVVDVRGGGDGGGVLTDVERVGR